MINDASVVIGGGNWGIKEADVLGYKLINSEYYARDIDFANSTAAGTYTDSTGVVRRSPYNLFTYSEQFDNAAWGKIGSPTVVDNAAIAPNGTLTADSVTGSGSIILYQGLFRAQTYTQSCYAKAGTGNVFGIYFGASHRALFDLTNGTVTLQTGGTASIQSVGDGWYRCVLTATTTADQYVGPNFTPNGTVFIWGAQLVEGTEALPYFPTTTRLNVPRIDYRNADGSLSTTGRLLLEPQRTNSIRNSSMVGAVAGTPGTLPTNYAQGGGGSGVTTRTIVGTGTENGLPYIDIRYQGNTAGQLRLITESGAIAAASVGSVYTNSTYIKLVSGTAPQIQLVISNRDASNNFISDNNGPLFNLSSTLTRYAYTATIAQAGTAFAQPLLQWAFAATTYDFTIRIAAPQMELGAYATTWIPTTTATVTRNADVASRTGVSSWIGQTQGTIYIDFEYIRTTGDSNGRLLGLYDTSETTNAILPLIFGSGANVNQFQLAVSSAGASTVAITASAATLVPFGRQKFAIAYNAGVYTVYRNGALFASGTSIAPVSLSNIDLGGSSAVARKLENPINQAMIFPTRLTNSQLQSLTTL